MTKTTITPDVVKTIESALEERKKGADRRRATASEYTGSERRKGERRTK